MVFCRALAFATVRASFLRTSFHESFMQESPCMLMEPSVVMKRAWLKVVPCE